MGRFPQKQTGTVSYNRFVQEKKYFISGITLFIVGQSLGLGEYMVYEIYSQTMSFYPVSKLGMYLKIQHPFEQNIEKEDYHRLTFVA